MSEYLLFYSQIFMNSRKWSLANIREQSNTKTVPNILTKLVFCQMRQYICGRVFLLLQRTMLKLLTYEKVSNDNLEVLNADIFHEKEIN